MRGEVGCVDGERARGASGVDERGCAWLVASVDGECADARGK